MKTHLLLIAFIISFFSTAQVYVDASATGANDGTSWADAYTDLAIAISNNSSNATDFWIVAGRYTPGNTSAARTTSFLPGSNHRFYGGFNGTETSLSQRNIATNITILSGDRANNDSGVVNFSNSTRADNFYRIVRLNNDGVVFDGISFRDGQGAGSTANGSVERMGAAIYATHEFDLNNCTFYNNYSGDGGVIQLQGQSNNANHTIDFVKCIFQDNVCSSDGIIAVSNAANSDLTLTVDHCLINDNQYNRGVISTNSARNNVTMLTNITGSTIANNFTTGSTNDNQVLRNRQGSNSTCDFNVENSIIWNNFSSTASGNPAVRLHGLSFQDSNNGGNRGNANVTHSLIQSTNGATSTNQITTANPLFITTGPAPYSLTINSPAIDSGSNALVTQTMDLAGNNRIQGSTVDMGPYEGFSNASTSGIVYVDVNATGGANNGTSWADAYTTLINAVNINSNSPVDFWIAAGTYYTGSTRTQSIQPGINHKFYGGFNGTETMLSERDFTVNKTIIDGDINGNDNGPLEQNNTTKTDNTYRLFQVYNDGVLFDGLEFRNGFALGSTANGSIERMGSAIYASHEFQVENCEFYDNLSFSGGVIQMQQQLSGANHNININNSIFQGNYCNDGIITSSNGTSSSLILQIENCLIADNIFKIGILSANSARTNVNMTATVVNTTIANNECDGTFTNTHIIRNRKGNNSSSSYSVYNSIISNNIIPGTSGNAIIEFHGLRSGDTNGGGSLGDAILSNSMPQSTIGATSTNNNIASSPIFTSTTDYTLLASSPGIDAGDNQFVTATTDLAGNTRIVGNSVDIGAYEFGSTASSSDVTTLKVSLFPNPATSEFTIALDQETIDQISMYNLQGQLVKTSTTDRVNVSELSKGIYLVKVVTTSGATATKQLIKK